MTYDKKCKVLIIATAFSPEKAVGSIRLTKFAKFLVLNGHQVTIISPTLCEGDKTDNSLECSELQYATRTLISQSSLFDLLLRHRRNAMLANKTAHEYIKKDAAQNFKNIIRTNFYRFMQYTYSIVRNIDWKIQVVNYSNVQYNKNEFDVILSSYPSLGAHWAAMALKRKGIAKRWIADFRDPINYETNSNLIYYYLNTRLQNRILSMADSVTCVSKGMAGKLLATCDDKITYLPNGFDIDDLPTIKVANVAQDSSKEFIFCYVGSLYGGERDLSVLFKAIRDLKIMCKDSGLRIRLLYAGAEFSILKKQATRYDLAHILIDKGIISRQESLQLQHSADCVIVATWNTERDRGVIPGKLFECFLINKTIIGIVSGTNHHSELSEMVKYVNGGFVYEHASPSSEQDYMGLVGFMYELFTTKISGCLVNNYNENVESYSYKNIVDKLCKLMV